MNRFFTFLTLLLTTVTFSQTDDIKKKPIKKQLPIELSISFGTQFFYQGYNKAWTSNDAGDLLRYTTDQGFKKPMYGFNVALSKPISEHFAFGVEVGYAKVQDDRDHGGNTYHYAIPLSLNTTYTVVTNKKARLRPFVTVKGGYTFFKSNSRYSIQFRGGLHYSVAVGLGFKSKNYKFLNNLKLSIGYTDFITNVESDLAISSATAPFYYKVHRKGLVLKLIYIIPLKHKKKRRKHR
jgi:hypothetical protein